MTNDPLGVLFDRYRQEGDLAALARVVETVAPELLRLARHLRPRGQTPEDLVQATFLAALTSQESYDSGRPMRPWLLGILLNKAAGGRRPEFELAIELPDRDSTENDAEAGEAARLLARGLDRLPAIYSEVLRDHFYGGMSPGEIADRDGQRPATVRSQLHRGLRLLRMLVPTGLAGRLLWLGPSRSSLLRVRRAVLDQAAVASSSVSVRPGLPPLAGVRITGALAIAVVGALGLYEWSTEPQGQIFPESSTSAIGNQPRPALPVSRAHEKRTPDGAEVTAPSQPGEAATNGGLVVRVLYSDGDPAPGIGLRLYAWGEPSRIDNQTDGVTDAAGEFSLESIHAGRVGIYCDRGGDQGFGVTVTAGEQAVREISLPPAINVVGDVVDIRGIPVPGAGIWLSESPASQTGRITLSCDEFGRFHLRDVSPRRFIGAQASGFAPSEIEWLASGGLREGSSTRIRLVLADGGGSIAGTVVDALGIPVQAANVVVRSKIARGIRIREDGAMLGPSTPFEATTSAYGRFEFTNLALGEYELVVRMAGHSEYCGSVQLSPSKPFDDLELRLQARGKLSGTVSFPDGQPATGAAVIAKSGVLGLVDHEVDERGAFVLEGLALGRIEVQAGFGHSGGGQLARTTLWLDAGVALRWDAVVERPQDYSGRILGPYGKPLPGAWLQAVAKGGGAANAALPKEKDALGGWLAGWGGRYTEQYLYQIAADPEGRFTLRGIPRPFVIEMRFPEGRTGWADRVFDPPPANGELVLSTNDVHTARINGAVEDSGGQLISTGVVYAVLRAGGSRRTYLDTNGAFRFEALPPGTFDILLWARGHFPLVVAEVSLAEGEERDLGWLRPVR